MQHRTNGVVESRMKGEKDETSASTPKRRAERSETILLVEADDQVRAVMRTILQRQGYEILEAQNAGEAFRVSENFGTEIHLLITDISMPRMSGLVLAERLGAKRPRMRVLYMSDYSEDWVVRQGVLDERARAFLQKPITPELLAKKVRAVLHTAGGEV